MRPNLGKIILSSLPREEPVRREGRVITFYSYKGGTGRSMALMNVAWCLALNKQRVLVIDWDLEAPGLHRFLHPFLQDDPDLARTPGLLDLMGAFAAASAGGGGDALAKIDVFDYVHMLQWPAGLASGISWKSLGGSIDLLPAGTQNATYAGQLAAFDWISFYERLSGRQSIAGMMSDFRQAYDYVLIDSRTGVSDTSGICTVELPDTLVVCFTLNKQSILGASSICDIVREKWERLGHEKQTISGRADGQVRKRIFPVPSRVEITSEKERREYALDLARQTFALHLEHLEPGRLAHYWGNVQLPYFPYYAFEEIPAVFGDDPDENLSLLTPVVYLASLLTDGKIRSSSQISLISDTDGATAQAARIEVLGKYLLSPAATRSPQIPSAPARRGSGHSQYSHGSTYDLFVSYSARDVDWVKPFYDDLIKEINRWATPDIHPFLDQISIAGGDTWDERIMMAVRDSAILVPVMTPQYFASDYCQNEVRAFVDAHKTSTNRIMPVALRQYAPRGHVLSNLQAAAFSRVSDDGIPRDFKQGSPDYRDALTKLGYAIAKSLQNMTQKPNGRAAVFLAADFSKQSEKLRASLSHHFDVLPDYTLGEWMAYTAQELHQALDRDFLRSIASIHRLGSAAPLAQPLIDAQLAFARSHSDKPRLVWTPDRPDELTTAGFEWFTSAAEIEERIRRLAEGTVASRDKANRVIYFLCPDSANRRQAEPLLQRLKERGISTYVAPLEGQAEHVMQEHVNLLDEADGCLIYYGDVDRAWFDGLYPRLRKKIRQRGLRTVIYVAPPLNDHKRDLRFQDWTVVEDFDAAAQAFLEGVG